MTDLLLLLSIIITLIAQFYVNSAYNKYKKISNKNNLSGVEVAQMILKKHGLENVYVTEVPGELTDHYDPNRKVVRLSTNVFHGTTIAAASVAAHEVGHAVQHKEGYFLIKLRGYIFPFASFASKFGYLAIMIGILFGSYNFAIFGIALLLFILAFQLVTLPVEINASERAKTYLKDLDILDHNELNQSHQMLKAAAYTYVASLATTLIDILRLFLIFSDNDR